MFVCCELALYTGSVLPKTICKTAQKADVTALPDTDEEYLAIETIKAVMYFHFCYPTAETYGIATGSEKCIRKLNLSCHLVTK